MDSNQPPNNSMIENDFFLCRLNDLEELQAIELTIEERKLFAIRQDNNVYAYWNSCPHMGIPLNWMPEKFLDLDGVFLQCSSHGALFQISNGECVGGPCVGDHLAPVTLKQDGDQYFIAANQPLPAPLVNLRAAALRDFE